MLKDTEDRQAKDLTDEELLFLIKYRYDDPIAILINRYSPLVASTARKYFLTGYEHDDLIQEGNTVLYRILDKYDTGRNVSFGHYLKRNITNEFNSLLRKDMAEKRKVDRMACSLEAMTDEHDNSYWENVVSKYQYEAPDEALIMKEKLSLFLSKLSRFEKRVFECYLQRLSAKEMAEKLDCPTAKIYNALSRCKKKLRDLIENNDI